MFAKIFPRHISNDYPGRTIARWFFIFLTIITIGRSLVHIFALDGGAQGIATIPLDTFSPNGAATVILVFSLWGLSQLLIGLIYAVVIWRYQALIPFMYLLMSLEYSARILLGLWKPIVTAGTAPGGVGNYMAAPLAFLMMILSLQKGRD